MGKKTVIEGNDKGAIRKAWLWVLLCALIIFLTIPVARGLQKYIYNTTGKEFFTYAVFFCLLSTLAFVMYYLIFKLKVRNLLQYIWLIACAGVIMYTTVKLKDYPEEAVHLLEYGILSIFIFRALSHRIHNWTIYITAALIVTAIGTMDEFIQWLTPSRYWGYNDVKINALAGIVFLLAIGKGIRPGAISRPVSAYSVKLSAKTASVLLIIVGLCLSNTPDAVKRYSEIIPVLSWLKDEEPMTEFGYRLQDHDIGSFYSRFDEDELRKIDSTLGTTYGSILSQDIEKGVEFNVLRKTHNVNNNKFLYEFIIHLSRIERNLNYTDGLPGTDNNMETAYIAYKESLIINKYFRNTLSASGFVLTNRDTAELRKLSTEWKGNYESTVGKLITFINLKTAWIYIVTALSLMWIPVMLRARGPGETSSQKN
jgi:VanZ family protein